MNLDIQFQNICSSQRQQPKKKKKKSEYMCCNDVFLLFRAKNHLRI